jgi:hypothetical protein
LLLFLRAGSFGGKEVCSRFKTDLSIAAGDGNQRSTQFLRKKPDQLENRSGPLDSRGGLLDVFGFVLRHPFSF